MTGSSSSSSSSSSNSNSNSNSQKQIDRCGRPLSWDRALEQSSYDDLFQQGSKSNCLAEWQYHFTVLWLSTDRQSATLDHGTSDRQTGRHSDMHTTNNSPAQLLTYPEKMTEAAYKAHHAPGRERV